jgi:hypothetical protein
VEVGTTRTHRSTLEVTMIVLTWPHFCITVPNEDELGFAQAGPQKQRRIAPPQQIDN